MRCSRQSVRDPCHAGANRRVAGLVAQAFLITAPFLMFASSVTAQDLGSQQNEFFGNGAVITVKLHQPSGEPLSSTAVVKLFRGVLPSGQKDASHGVAEFVVNSLGEFVVVVSAPGYAETQKDVSVDITGRTQVDVYLRPTPSASGVATVPGRAVLAPKAKEALDRGVRALKENKVDEAQKYVAEAARLAPSHPDVLYVQGVLSLQARNWAQAQTVLENATQMDPNSSRAFAALGMAFCNEGKYGAAVPPLQKSLQLDPAGTWQARWALAKSYYHLKQYEDALRMSQEALAQSNGSEPTIALLVAQSLTAVGRYEDAAQTLREFLRDHGDNSEAATARRWLEQLAASGKTRPN
jgi:Flp pilus assembly protein TadD